MFTMGNSTLYIQNLELQGLISNNANAALVRADHGGTFFMGIFSVVKCSHIGVGIANGGSFIMARNSVIRGSRVNGVHITGSQSRFEMEGDSRVINTSVSLGAGVHVRSGGIILFLNSTVVMTITGSRVNTIGVRNDGTLVDGL